MRRLPPVTSSRGSSAASRAAPWALLVLSGCAALFAGGAQAVTPQGTQGTPGASARAQQPFDLSGYWVSLITRDWRFRMIVPGKGEYAGIPIDLKAKQFADAWRPGPDQAAGKQCEAYGGGAILLVPERLHIRWQDDDDLRVQTDAGMQRWVIHFASPGSTAQIPLTRQGYAVAKWMLYKPLPSLGALGLPIKPPFAGGKKRTKPPTYGSLEVSVSRLLPGLIRKNGVPYSDRATVREYWEVHTGPTGATYLIVSQILRDPIYLQAPYYTTATFEKEANGSQWSPSPCTLTSTP